MCVCGACLFVCMCDWFVCVLCSRSKFRTITIEQMFISVATSVWVPWQVVLSVHLVEWFSMWENTFDVRGGQSFQLADVSCHIKASYAGRLFCDSVSNGTQVTDV